MLTTSARPYTDAEFNDYAGRMVSGRAYSITLCAALSAIIGGIVGGIVLLCSLGVHWFVTWLWSGAMTWTLSLVVGASAAIITVVLSMVVFWRTSKDHAWTDHPPRLATDVKATAYAAWRTESDSLDVVFVFRVDADRYLLITENALTPPLLNEPTPGASAETIPSVLRLVLLGEGPCRLAMNVALTGQTIPLLRVTAMPAETDPDRFDESPPPDGLYTTDELPTRFRRAIGVR